MAAELTDDIRVPLDSLHADALYLASRVAQGTMSAVRLSQVIRERIDAAKAALATQQAAQGAEPECFGLRFPSDQKLCLSTIFDTEEEAKDCCDQCSPGTVVVPLYTAPPPTAEVPTLSEEQVMEAGYDLLCDLAGIDTHETNLRDCGEAYLALDRYRARLQSDQAQAGKGE